MKLLVHIGTNWLYLERNLCRGAAHVECGKSWLSATIFWPQPIQQMIGGDPSKQTFAIAYFLFARETEQEQIVRKQTSSN